MNKNLYLVFAASFLLILTASLFFYFTFFKLNISSNKHFGQTYEIVLTEIGFSPSEITIKPGDSIKFSTKNNQPYWPASDLHPTHGIYPEFDPLKPVAPDKSWTFQFLKAGHWKFHDHLKPSFQGIIHIK